MANANTPITSDIILNEALMELKNQATIAMRVDRQYSGQFGNGQTLKRGDTVNVRRRVFFEAFESFATRGDVTGNIRDVEEGSVGIQMLNQPVVTFQLDSQELTLDVQDIRERYIRPAMIELVQNIESRITAEYVYMPWLTGTPGTVPSTFTSVATIDAIMDDNAVPMMDGMRCLFLTPTTMVSLAADLNNVFPTRIAETAIERALIMQYGGLDLYKNQSLQTHTVGAYTGSVPLVNGAAQEIVYNDTKDLNYHQQSLITDGWAVSTNDVINQGDTFTIDGVFQANPRTRQSTGRLQSFTVISTGNNSDAGGNLTLTISPGIITTGAFKTCDIVGNTLPDDSALTITSGNPDARHRQNLSWHKDAITLAMTDLTAFMGGVDNSQGSMDGFALRVAMDSDIITDINTVRIDCLYGVRLLEHRAAVRLTE